MMSLLQLRIFHLEHKLCLYLRKNVHRAMSWGGGTLVREGLVRGERTPWSAVLEKFPSQCGTLLCPIGMRRWTPKPPKQPWQSLRALEDVHWQACVLHQAIFQDVYLCKGRLSRNILYKVCWFDLKSAGKLYDVDEAYIPFPTLNSSYVGSVESTSLSKIFLGPSQLFAESTNAFTQLLFRIFAHETKILYMLSISLQTISSTYFSGKPLAREF